MRVYRHYENLLPKAVGGAVAVGSFDGVHLGHQAVINEAGAIARSANPEMPWGVLTFEPHPRQVIQPDDSPLRLSPLRLKTRYVEALGVDFMVVAKFNQTFATRSAQWFIDAVLVAGLQVSHLVAGYDFRFGQDRAGDCRLLLNEGKKNGFGFACVSAVADSAGVPYSSTRIRDCLSSGDPRGATELLGRHFEIESRVVRGFRRGRELGFPTANMRMEGCVRPKPGVYAVRAGIDKGGKIKWMDGIANLGCRPTFRGTDLLLETHIFEYDKDLYGTHLRVAFVDYIRPEIKFANARDIERQIGEDCQVARKILDETGP